MGKIVEALSGVKTYLIAAVVVVGTLLEKFAGVDVPGFDPGSDWLAFILAALGASTIRAGIAKGPAG